SLHAAYVSKLLSSDPVFDQTYEILTYETSQINKFSYSSSQYQLKMTPALINANPIVYEKKERPARIRQPGDNDFDEYSSELIDQLEIFDIRLCVIFLFFS
nr:protein AE7-like [Tanacetum cinerariifolium]GFB03193.1 protein AE7-like [Tanacetum cinerariifolium]